MPREIKYKEAVLEATDLKMADDEGVYVIGLGVPDPKRIFGTTSGLLEKYGPDRVMDMPTSENAMMGVAVGTALMGFRPILTHQRVDFFLLALDQLINNAAKWNYMFGGKRGVPLVIRLIIGRGWGQGPQHSQSLQSFFAHIPGLKVVMPATPYDAKGLLISAIEDPNPVVFLEHRWLHETFGEVPKEVYRVPIGKARVVKEGTDVTLVTSSHMTLEGLQAAQLLEKEGISVELIDLRSVQPLDRQTILTSVRKTGYLVVADPDWKEVGVSSEVVACVTEEALSSLKAPPVRIAYPHRFCPTSWALSNYFYPTAKEIIAAILKLKEKLVKSKALLKQLILQRKEKPLDVPDRSFTGPF